MESNGRSTDGPCVKKPKMDEDYKKDGEFMKRAQEEAKISSLLGNEQVGACIVDENGKVIGAGYSKVCPGMDNEKHGEVASWISTINEKTFDGSSAEICHAIMIAIVNCYVSKDHQLANLRNCDLYVTRFPCNTCSKIIIQSGIRCIVLDKEENSKVFDWSKKLLGRAGVQVFHLSENKRSPIQLSNQLIGPAKVAERIKNKSYSSWDEYFIRIALLMAKKGEDPENEVGLCVANNENLIVAFGFDSKDEFEAVKKALASTDVNGQVSTLYITRLTTEKCAEDLKGRGFKSVKYYEGKAWFDFMKQVTLREKFKMSYAFNKGPDFFMAIAKIARDRSKDPNRQVGACIVNQDEEIIGIGYNGMPSVPGRFNDEEMPWGDKKDPSDKRYYVCHAEMNALTHKIGKTKLVPENCTLYTTWFPCYDCAKMIIQLGFKTVVYEDKPNRHKNKSPKGYDCLFSEKLLTLSKIDLKWGTS